MEQLVAVPLPPLRKGNKTPSFLCLPCERGTKRRRSFASLVKGRGTAIAVEGFKQMNYKHNKKINPFCSKSS